MNLPAYFRSLTAKFFRRSELDEEMEAELRSHMQHRADDLERSGISRAEAERRARLEFGAQEKFKEEIHQTLPGNFLDTLMQDIRVSLRVLRKSPGFTAIAVLTLALAIGANAVVFSVLNAFILRPLNVRRADSLYAVWRANKTASESYLDYLDLRDRNHSFESLIGYDIGAVGLDTGNNPTREWIQESSGNYFDALGVQPYLGRFFHASDERGANSAPYIVLSHAFWHTHFHDDRNVIGRIVQLNRHPYTIVGVTPPEFHGTLIFFHPTFFVPLVNMEEIEGPNILNNRAKHSVFMVMGHLKPGITPAQASADLNSIGAYLEKTYPKDESKMTFTLARPSLYGDYLGGPVRMFMTGLMLMAGLILLAACANLGSLFAARAADRSREVALRLALGSSRSRILRQVFTEALLISAVGGALGMWGSVLLLRALSGWQPFARWPIHLPVNPDGNVYLVALLLALASGFLFGAVPVRQILHTNPYEVMKLGPAGPVGKRISVRDLLLVAQIAICAVLVTSSMVAVRGLVRSIHGNFGFQPQNAMLADTDLTMAGYRGDKVPEMQKRIVESLEAIPGVEAVGVADQVILGDGPGATNVFTESTTDLRPANAASRSMIFSISPDYLRADGAVLLSGRTFTWHDDQNAPRVAIINREFARKMFGSVANALGSYYKIMESASAGTHETRLKVVGVVEDAKYESLTEDPKPAMFLPIVQAPSSSTWIVVRSKRDPQQLAAAMKKTFSSLDAGLPVYIQTRYKELDLMLFGPRIATMSLGVLGFLGAVLSITGIFGMAAYAVSKRLRELGIRIALGAERMQVLHAALGRAFKLLAVGSIAGLLLGILASRVLAFIVYRATPRDPVVLTAVVLAMAMLGLLATWIPAQRALSVDPLILLRDE